MQVQKLEGQKAPSPSPALQAVIGSNVGTQNGLTFKAAFRRFEHFERKGDKRSLFQSNSSHSYRVLAHILEAYAQVLKVFEDHAARGKKLPSSPPFETQIGFVTPFRFSVIVHTMVLPWLWVHIEYCESHLITVEATSNFYSFTNLMQQQHKPD